MALKGEVFSAANKLKWAISRSEEPTGRLRGRIRRRTHFWGLFFDLTSFPASKSKMLIFFRAFRPRSWLLQLQLRFGVRYSKKSEILDFEGEEVLKIQNRVQKWVRSRIWALDMSCGSFLMNLSLDSLGGEIKFYFPYLRSREDFPFKRERFPGWKTRQKRKFSAPAAG